MIAGLVWSILFVAPSFSLEKTCRCFLGDDCWPSPDTWSTLNDSIHGNLVATVPLGAPCHDPLYNAAVCKSLQQNWLEPEQQYVIRTLRFILCAHSKKLHFIFIHHGTLFCQPKLRSFHGRVRALYAWELRELCHQCHHAVRHCERFGFCHKAQHSPCHQEYWA